MPCSRSHRAGCVALLVLFATLAGCGRSPAPSAAVGPDGLPGDHATTGRYTVRITYPPLSPEADALTRVLHQHGEAAKRDLMKAVHAAPTGHPVRLVVVFEVASRTPPLLSVREKGLLDNGGAHPRPIIGTFVFDMRTRKLVSLGDLFTNPAATRARLASFARKALYAKLLDHVPGGTRTPPKARAEWQANMRAMIDPGTTPTAAHFSHFLVNGGSLHSPMSLTLVFPPNQVAPYVYGVQTVKVPLKRIAADLKPAYRTVFGLAP